MVYSLSLGGASATLASNTTYALSATETLNGKTISPGTLVYSVDSAVGSVSGNVLTTVVSNGKGNVSVTDSAHGVSSSLAVAVLSSRPVSNGNSYSYAGTLTETIVRPLPAPVASQAPYSFSTAVTQTVAVTTGQSFNGATNAVDFQAVEQDGGATQALGSTTDTFLNFVPNGGIVDVFNLGNQSIDSNGVKTSLTRDPGNGLIDTIPQQVGAFGQNTGAATTVESDPDGTTLTRKTNADGSYQESDVFPGGLTGSITNNVDGSGTLVSANGTKVEFGAPTSGGIPVSLNGHALPNPVPLWYPGGSVQLYTETDSDAGVVVIPAACAVPVAVGTQATQVVSSIQTLDPVLGFIETKSESDFTVPAFGVVCTQLVDTTTDYYDYSGQGFVLAPVPQQITTTTETLGIVTATVALNAARERSASVARGPLAMPVRPAMIAALHRAMVRESERRRSVLVKAHLSHLLESRGSRR